MDRQAAFEEIGRLYSYLSVLSGLDVLKRCDFLKLSQFQFFMLNAVFFLVSEAKTIVISREDFLEMSFCLCVVGFAFQGFSLNHSLFFNHRELSTRFENIKAYHIEKQGSEAEELIKDKYAKFSYFLCKVYGYGYLMAAIGVITCPLCVSLVFGLRETPFRLLVLFADHRTETGFWINFGYQAMQIILCVPCMCSYQVLYIVTVFHYCCLIDVMISKMDRPSVANLKEMLAIHWETIEIHNEIEALFGNFNLVQLICTVFQAVLTAYILITRVWYQGYILFSLSLSQLCVTCIYGTMIESKAIELERAMFNVMPWRSLSVSDQKCAGFMLLMMQNKQQLGCGINFILGMPLFVSVMNCIYSMCTMLTQIN